jgi:hypothetical protein
MPETASAAVSRIHTTTKEITWLKEEKNTELH